MVIVEEQPEIVDGEDEVLFLCLDSFWENRNMTETKKETEKGKGVCLFTDTCGNYPFLY